MSYWHCIRIDGWVCPDCGITQYGEYYCEACAEHEREMAEKRERNAYLKAMLAREPSLSPQERRRKGAKDYWRAWY